MTAKTTTKKSSKAKAPEALDRNTGGGPEESFEDVFEEAEEAPDKLKVEQTFIDKLLAGKLRLTDKLFFSKVDQSLDYLRTKPFQDRVSDWLISDNQEMIDKLQAAIELERRGRKQKAEYPEGAQRYYDNCVLIYDFKDKHPAMPDVMLNQAFLKAHPGSDIRFDQHRSIKEIAIHLTVKQLGIKKRTLRTIISKVQVLPIRRKTINKIPK